MISFSCLFQMEHSTQSDKNNHRARRQAMSLLFIAALTSCIYPAQAQSNEIWAGLPTTDAPQSRYGHTAVWTGSQTQKMIVFGGFAGDTEAPSNTGGVYDLTANSWNSTMSGSVPVARWGHTSVWDGDKMLIWGGGSSVYFGKDLLDSGAVFNPSSNSWTSMTAPNPPSARSNHTAVWTGSKMVIWGGFTDSGRVNDGGVYDPTANSWTSTPTTNAPSSRSDHTAIWTGSKMIVWGGDANGLTNTGAIYDPAANSWTSMSTTSAPSARHQHTAVWTDSKMIVWGGWGAGGLLNNGAIYDPDANSWTSISTTNAPSARSQHTAVWTGSKMIVWGGEENSRAVNTGGIYDPSTNMWTATPMDDGTPSDRERHTAVWTNSGMIIWGGTTGVQGKNTGAIYGDKVEAASFSGPFVSTSWSTGENPEKQGLLSWEGAPNSLVMHNYQPWPDSGVTAAHVVPFNARIKFSWRYHYVFKNPQYIYIPPGCPAGYRINKKWYNLMTGNYHLQQGTASFSVKKGDTIELTLNGSYDGVNNDCNVRNPTGSLVRFTVFNFMAVKE